MALKPLKPSKQKRKDSKFLASVEQQAREWLAGYNSEMQRRQEFLAQQPPELQLTHVSWKQYSPSLDSLSPLVQAKVKELQL